MVWARLLGGAASGACLPDGVGVGFGAYLVLSFVLGGKPQSAGGLAGVFAVRKSYSST